MDSLAQQLAKLRSAFDRLLSGQAHSDPLHVSNRTFGQKLRRGMLLALPVVVVVGVVAALSIFKPAAPDPRTGLPAIMAPPSVPELDKGIELEANKDLIVMDVRIDRAAGKIVGTVRNTTSHQIHSGQVVINVTEAGGSVLGAVKIEVNNIAAGASVPIQAPVPHPSAAYAIVREVHTQ